jgi:nucleoside-diphosphate-sugar epimerase
MAGELVLLTGATGLVGFAVLRAALEKGYKIRAAVRSEEKAETVRSNPTLKNISDDQLSFVIVPDIIPEGAFDEAVKGVKFILHVASPLPAPHISGEDDLHSIIVEPAIQGTLGIFKSARKAGTVQRIVVTSSAAALIPMAAMSGQVGEGDVFGPDHRVDALPPPYMNIPQVAYNASKILALKHAEDYIANENPGFDAIHIHPSVVIGRDELALTAKDLDRGSNHYALAPVLGESVPTPFPMSICHIEDVAEAHVRALHPEIKGNQSFLLCCTGEEGYEVCIDRSIPHLLPHIV